MNVQVYLRLNPLKIATPDFAMPTLERLIAKGSVTKTTHDFESVLCKEFGIERQIDWPAAALSWLGEGNDPESYLWLYSDPVNLQLQRDHFSLNLPAPVFVSLEESAALSASLNQHFSADGLRFLIGPSGQWYVRLPEFMSVGTSSIEQAANRDVREYMPKGDAAEALHKLINEVQMLLHDHPVNQAREEMGHPIINSLWFSSAGNMPSQPTLPPRTVLADGVLAKGLAQLSAVSAFPIPQDFKYPDCSHQDITLVLDNDLHDTLLCEQWFKTSFTTLSARKIKQLVIHICVLDQHVRVDLKSGDLWKFWRKPQPLKNYFSW